MAASRSRTRTTPDIPGRPLVVDVAHLRPNDWNPNRQDAFIYQREKESIRRFGFVVPVICRTDPDDIEHWQIIDGEHRHKAAIDLGMTRIPIWDLGPIEDHIAKSLTIVLNETKGAPEPAKLGDLLRDLLADESRESLLDVMPISPAAFDALVGLKHFDWGILGEPIVAPAWVERTFRLPPDAAEVLDQALARARARDPHIADWQAIEFIAAEFLS
jgi:ParB-like nuclease domain